MVLGLEVAVKPQQGFRRLRQATVQVPPRVTAERGLVGEQVAPAQAFLTLRVQSSQDWPQLRDWFLAWRAAEALGQAPVLVNAQKSF